MHSESQHCNTYHTNICMCSSPCIFTRETTNIETGHNSVRASTAVGTGLVSLKDFPEASAVGSVTCNQRHDKHMGGTSEDESAAGPT